MREPTLDAFVPEDDGDTGSDDAATAEDTAGDSAVAGAVDAGTNLAGDAVGSVYSWISDGAPCEACGAVIEGRWRDAGRWVCADCKQW